MEKLIFRVVNLGITAFCHLFYNPPVHVAMVRIFS
jgi:hypothetical protein